MGTDTDEDRDETNSSESNAQLGSIPSTGPSSTKAGVISCAIFFPHGKLAAAIARPLIVRNVHRFAFA